MKLKIELNEDLINLIQNFNVRLFNHEKYGVCTNDYLGGTYLYEQMANILGYADKAIPETLENPCGALYEAEYQSKMEKYDDFLANNMLFIEEILHQFCGKGGLKPGIYTTLDRNRIWEYQENEKEAK